MKAEFPVAYCACRVLKIVYSAAGSCLRTTYEEILFAKPLCTLSYRLRPLRLSIYSYREAFIDAKSVYVQCSYGHAGEMLNLSKDTGSPFA